jgi:23S rRNA (pseudouridine1915-N3)-methyltransferase
MKIGIIAVGRLKAGPERELAERYADRFAASGKVLGLTGPALSELTESQSRSAAERKTQEAQAILAAVDPDALVIALDERGKTLSSDAFAAKIGQWRDSGRKNVSFVIGGADGIGESVRARAQEMISFGQMTMPHQLVRVILLEQLYRAATILSGHPYHRV